VTGSAAAPSLAFGDGNTGFYESADNVLGISFSGNQRWEWTAATLESETNNGAGIKRSGATSTTPVFFFHGDDNVGIGRAGEDSLSLIAGGVEGIRVAEGGGKVKATVTDTLEIKGAGTLSLHETTTPGAVDDYGKIYTKSDNELYFQDGGGTEHMIMFGASDYGEMGNVYGSSATEVLHSADEWHAMFHANITGTSPHLNSGFTFVAGKEGSGNITTAQGGSSINIADTDHGLATGDYVTVQSANHNGVGTVLYVDANNFEVDITYVGNEASTWQMGSYLLVATTGVYKGTWSASFSQSDNATRVSIISPFLNTTQATKATASRALDNNTDEGSIGGNGIMSFTAGDRIWFATQSSDPQTLTFTIRNISIR